MTPPRIAAIVLAAGRSSRMPANKLLTPLDDKPVIRRTVEAVCASQSNPVIVVTGHQANRVSEALSGLPITITENVMFADGLSSSIICGVKSLPKTLDGFVVVLGDMPYVPPAVIDQLIAAFDPANGRGIIVPVNSGKRGNPVLWATLLVAEFLALTGDRGAKHLMALHSDLLYELKVDSDSVLTDLDTPEDFTT